MPGSKPIAACSDFSFSGIVDVGPEYGKNGSPFQVDKVINTINKEGGELRRTAWHMTQPVSALDPRPLRPTLSVLGTLLMACSHIAFGEGNTRHRVGHLVNALETTLSNGMAQLKTIVPAFSLPFSFPAASAHPVNTHNAHFIPWSRLNRNAPPPNVTMPDAASPYSAKEIGWINQNAVVPLCYEPFLPFADSMGKNKIFKLCGTRSADIQLAVQMSDKIIAVEALPHGTLDVVLAFNPYKPEKTREIELKDGQWVFSAKTDRVVSNDLLIYYKVLKQNGLISAPIANRTAFLPNALGLRGEENNQFVIIRGDNVLIKNTDNAWYLVLKNRENDIHVPLSWENNKLTINNPNRKKTIGTDKFLTLRYFPAAQPQEFNTFRNTAHYATLIMSAVKEKLKNLDEDGLSVMIERQLSINFNNIQIRRIKNNILRQETLLNKIINTQHLFRDVKNYDDRLGTLGLRFYSYPQRAAGEVDQSAQLHFGTINIYPVFYQQHLILRVGKLFDIANRAEGGKSLFLFDTHFLNDMTPSHHRVSKIDMDIIIQEFSNQIKNHLAHLASNATAPSVLTAGKDTRSSLEGKQVKFMQGQYWRYMKEQEIVKQDAEGSHTLLEYRDGLERWHMPLAQATDAMRADRHFIKKAPLDSAFLSLIGLMIYNQETEAP